MLQFFSKLQKTGKIKQCDECHNTNIMYDSSHDEIFCHDCGLVLLQNYHNYMKNEPEKKHKRKNSNKTPRNGIRYFEYSLQRYIQYKTSKKEKRTWK